MTLAEKIQILRKQTKLSQEDLAERVGVSRQAVSKWESEQCVPEIDKVIQLSDVFGVTTDYLLKDTQEPQECTALVTTEGVLPQNRKFDISMLFAISTGLILGGVTVALLIWFTVFNSIWTICIGLAIQGLGCAFFEKFKKYVAEPRQFKEVRQKFYVVNCFFLMLIPTYIVALVMVILWMWIYNGPFPQPVILYFVVLFTPVFTMIYRFIRSKKNKRGLPKEQIN